VEQSCVGAVGRDFVGLELSGGTELYRCSGKGFCGIGVKRWDRVVSVQWEGDLWDWN
jgi:hypothetical protein